VRPVRVAVSLILLALVCAALAGAQEPSPSVAATVPRLIRITGTLHDAGGKSLTGNVPVTFALYQDQNDTTATWEETQTISLDASGHYSVLLGSTNANGLPLEIFSAGQARWLGVRPEGQTEQPRILLLSVAYALKAADADTLGGKPASAFVLVGSQGSAQPAGSQPTAASSAPFALATPPPPSACTSITSDGTGTANQLTKFTTACNIENSAIFEAGGKVGIGNKVPAGVLDVSGTSFFRGMLSSLGGVNMLPTGAATATQGFISNPLDLSASVFNTTLSQPVNYMFQWQAEPANNDTTNTGATLNLLYGVSGDVAETGLSINKAGIFTFAPGQTFPGASGTVTSVATGAGLTGGPITKTGTISIATGGVTNAMLATPSVTVKAGNGLSGGGTVALGGTITLTNSAPSLGGTVTSVGSGTGLTGGPITGSGTLNLDTAFTDARYLQLGGGTLTGGLTGTTGTFSGALKATTGTFTGPITATGGIMPNLGTATATQGFNSSAFDFVASSFSSSTSAAVQQRFRWQAEAKGNDTANPSASLNLLFAANGGTPAETGLSVASNGLITFAAGQAFPGTGSGTVTSVATGAGLTGGTITKTGTIGIANGGVTNAMLATPSVTVTAGNGLSGGGTVALGGTITLTNSAPSSGGTVTSVATGAGLTGGTITKTGTIGVANGGITNAMLAAPSIIVNTGTGLSGGGTVALGGTITLTNTAPSSGGTVTSVASGTGLTGGPITGSGTLSLNTAFTDARYLQLGGGTLTGALAGTTANFTGALKAASGNFTGLLSASAGGSLPSKGTATATAGFNSNPLDFVASSFSSGTSAAVSQDFRWQAESVGNDSANPSGTLNLLFGANGATPAETGLSVSSNGLITFSSGQTFPGTGSGTVTSIATGAGLIGGTITNTGTIGIATGGVTNAMLATPSITVTAGSGLSGGGTVALGGTITLTNSAPSSGGTVTSVATGAGLTGGTITNTGTIGIAAGGVTNTMLATPSITVNTGTGLSGGGTVALGGTITLTNTAPSSGGTVTSVASGTGLTGGPITGNGTLSLDTTFTDGRYLQLGGGTLTGALAGTTGTFSGALKATTGTFTGPINAAGGIMPNTGTATATQGFNSNAFDFIASSFNSGTVAAVQQRFRWQAEAKGNDTANPTASLNLLFAAAGGIPSETGLSVASNGLISFAAGQTFPGTGNGTITQVTAGSGLTGGGASGNVTLSLLNTCAAGQTLVWSGTTWSCGSYGAVSGTTNGIAYLAGPATVTSTAAPANGQILIGSTGTAPVLSTLTAGQNVTITNNPGSITIASNGPAPLPMFTTGGSQTGASLSPTQNVTTLWGFLLPYSVTTTQITYDVTTADNTANTYDIGIFNNAGNLVLDISAVAGTTFAPSAAFNTLAWTQGSTTLPAGRYYLAFTTNCASNCAAIGGTSAFVSFAVNASGGTSTGGALPSTMTPPADAWNSGTQPTIVMH
jgi:fibronectin-binding autotransporter adhesin